MELRREYCTGTASLTHEFHPPTHPQEDKAPVLDLGKLTSQFIVFQALNST